MLCVLAQNQVTNHHLSQIKDFDLDVLGQNVWMLADNSFKYITLTQKFNVLTEISWNFIP